MRTAGGQDGDKSRGLKRDRKELKEKPGEEEYGGRTEHKEERN